MRNNKMNGYLSVGLLMNSIGIAAKHFMALPEVIIGFLLGLGIALELIGLYALNHDITKLKRFKMSLFTKLIK